jgi:hypothetical protein
VTQQIGFERSEDREAECRIPGQEIVAKAFGPILVRNQDPVTSGRAASMPKLPGHGTKVRKFPEILTGQDFRNSFRQPLTFEVIDWNFKLLREL